MDLTLPALVVLTPVLISAQTWFLVRKMSEPEQMMTPIDGGLTPDRQARLLHYRDWLAALQFKYLLSFQFGSIQVAVFQQENTNRFFSFYFHQKLSFDIETRFDDLTCLDTATSGSTGMFPPRPGAYGQGFPGLEPADAWRLHIEAEEHLIRKFGIVRRPLSKPYLDILLASMRTHMKYIRSIPLWPCRATWWFFVRRKQMRNLSIQQQFP